MSKPLEHLLAAIAGRRYVSKQLKPATVTRWTSTMSQCGASEPLCSKRMRRKGGCDEIAG